MTTRFDRQRYKAEQRRSWGAAAAGWDKWWEVFERSAQRVSDRLVELAEIGPEDVVLDIATGIGEPAITAARRVGPTGRVVAVDQSSHMLGLARRRMASLGLTNVEFVEADAEALSGAEALGTGSSEHATSLEAPRFHAVLSRWGLMFLPNVEDTLRSLHGLLVPGGRLAAAVWSSAESVPLVSAGSEIAARILQESPPPEGTPTPFSLSDPVALESRLRRAGFTDVSSEPLTVTFEFPSSAEFIDFLLDVRSSLVRLRLEAPERVSEVVAALEPEAARFTTPGGSVRLDNEAILVRGRRPRKDDAGGAERQVRCPFCGSADTQLESAFGSTLGFAQYWCSSCRTGFEYLKWEEERPSP